MTVAKGTDCDSFRASVDQPEFRPFYGEYSSTGTSSDTTYSYDDSYSDRAGQPRRRHGRRRRLRPAPLRVAAAGGAGGARPGAGTTAADGGRPATGTATATGRGTATGRASDRAALAALDRPLPPLRRARRAAGGRRLEPRARHRGRLAGLAARAAARDRRRLDATAPLGGPLFYAGLWLALALWAVRRHARRAARAARRDRGAGRASTCSSCWRRRCCRRTSSPTSPTPGSASSTTSTRTSTRRSTIPGDAVYPYAGSKTATSAYGPLFTLATYPLRRARRAHRVLDPQGRRGARVARARVRSCGEPRSGSAATRSRRRSSWA